MKREPTVTEDFDLLYQAVEHALANFTGEDDIDETIIELVAHRIDEHLEKMGADPVLTGYFDDILASTSTYVQTDMDEETLNDYVGELVEQMETYGVL
jgi:hypothetical protein